jgi:hypothetical protein
VARTLLLDVRVRVTGRPACHDRLQDGTADRGAQEHGAGIAAEGAVTVRVYLPTTLARLREARTRGGFGPVPLAGHAVTPALEALGQ